MTCFSPSDPTPHVSVVVSTKNRSHLLPDLFAALAAQDIDRPFEVIVADDASTDDTGEKLDRLAAAAMFPVEIVSRVRSTGPAAGRNAAARLARAGVLAFTDDDCRPEPGWLRAGVAASTPNTVVLGRVAPPDDAAPAHPLRRVVRSEHWQFFSTSNAFYRRDDFEAVGGFDEAFTGCAEDTDLGLRVMEAGARASFVPEATVVHLVRPPDLRRGLREAQRWHDIPFLVRRHPDLRETTFHNRLFWREEHQWFVIAAIGVTATRRPLGALAALPWLYTRLWRNRSRLARLRWTAAAPALAAIDATEVAALVRGSIRARTLFL